MKNVHPNTTLGRYLCKDTALWRVEMPFGGSLESHHCCSFSLVPTYSSQPLSAAGVPAQAAVVQESCEELGQESKEGRRREDVERGESRRQLPAAREGSEEEQRSVPSSVLLISNYLHGVFWTMQSRRSCNWNWSCAPRHNLQCQCVQPRFGWVSVSFFSFMRQ